MNRHSSIKRILTGLWVLGFPAFLVFWYYPNITFRIRVMAFFAGLFILFWSIVMAWRTKFLQWILILVYVLFAVFLLFPSVLPENREKLRSNYCSALESYTACPYVWGGEGYFGIDCSGFVRKGLEDALVEQGFSNLNPALVRQGIWLYWHDTTAKVIGEGYGGRTFLVATCPSLNALDYSLVRPGDLAVTADGSHIMAYLGDKNWIAADPGEEKVTKFKIPEKKNLYFSVPMKIVRWTILKN